VNELLAIAQLTGVFFFLGGALFRRLVWNTVSTDTSDSLNFAVERRIKRLMISGAVLFLIATLSGTWGGWINALPAALAPVFVAAFLASEARKSPVAGYLAAVTGLIIIGSLAATSHSATEPGLLPIASNIVHWIAVVIWGGCLVYMTALPWSAICAEVEQRNAGIGNIRHRYAILAVAALGLFALSGGLLAFIHVHNADAMNTTDYGRFVMLKAAIVGVLLITVSINLLARRLPFQRFRAILSVETILLAGLLAATGALEVRFPPGVSPFNNPQSWQMTTGELPLTLDLQPVSGSSTQVRIEISAVRSEYRFPEGTLAFFDIYTPRRDAGGYDLEALAIGPSGFLGEAVLAIPGEWHFDLRLSYPDGTWLAGESVVVLPALPLRDDLKPFLSLSAITYSSPGLITFVVGVLLILSAGWLLRQSWHRKAPFWLMPVSMANMILGAYLALSVAFVKTYPSTFWSNPQPYEAAVIQQGDVIYREQCAECHGLLGKGDGPWAKKERGSIPDLTKAHMDSHTDGEIFWWLTKGIPSLDKPPLSDELSESERWKVINYIRNLRHGMPAQ
jgi:putative copper export protein/mono/diheme cytochrome c family protein